MFESNDAMILYGVKCGEKNLILTLSSKSVRWLDFNLTAFTTYMLDFIFGGRSIK